MTLRFPCIARRAGITLAAFGLLAAGEAPRFDASASFAVEADTAAMAQSDETTVSAAPIARPASLTRLVTDIAALPAPPLDAEAKCLTRAVFFEARGEPLEGQLAVAQVILNRTASGKYPASVCGVVDQPRQFTFARRGADTRSADWRTAQAIAIIAQAERWLQVAPRAMAFHATRVQPGWGGMERVARIGNHVFYR